jgi:hypothetical protein
MSLLSIGLVSLFACSDDDASEAGAAACDLLTEQDAVMLLNEDVVELAVNDLIERAGEERGVPLSESERADAGVAFSRTCSYAPAGEIGFTLATVQVDRGLFRSTQEFEGAWPDGSEILTGPGMAAALVEAPSGGASLHVLLNDQGDSLVLSVSGTPVDRASLLAVGEEVVSRY